MVCRGHPLQKGKRCCVEFVSAFPLHPMAGVAEQIQIAVGHSRLQRTPTVRPVDLVFSAPQYERRDLALCKARVTGEIPMPEIGNAGRAL